MSGIQVNNPNAIQNLSSEPNVKTAVKASIGGQKVKQVNLNKALQDFAEEATFGHEERVDADDKVEDAIDDRARQLREQMIKKIKEIYEKAPAKEDHNAQMQRLQRKANNPDYTPQDLLDDLGGEDSDKGQLFASLLELQATTDSEPAKTTIQKAIEIASDKWESQIFAAANTLDDAIKFSEETQINRDELQRSYQDSVVEYSSVITTLASLVNEFGVDKLGASADFLQSAAVSDLAAMPCSVDKEKLNATLLELQGMKIMHTIDEGINTSLERAAGTDKTLGSIKNDWMMSNFLRSLADPNIFTLNIKGRIDSSNNPQSKVLLLQDLKQQITDIPEHYFQSGQKQRSISPWQREIDHLVQIEADEA